MSPTTVGILGHTGRIGSQIVKHLIKYQNEGKVKLVILHRPSSNISALPKDVETRVLDLDKVEPEAHAQAVKGLQVVMSVVAMDAMHVQNPLLRALAKSDDLVAFTLAQIGSPFSEAEMVDPKLDFFIGDLKLVEEYGLTSKWTLITSGEYTDYVFGHNLFGTNVKENTVQLYQDALNKRAPLATTPYLGAAMAQLTLTDPSKWAGKLIQVYDYAPTGQEIIDAFTSLHGKPTTVTRFSDEDIKTKADSSDFGALEAMLIRHWGDGHLEDADEVVKSTGGWREVPRDFKVDPLEVMIKGYM